MKNVLIIGGSGGLSSIVARKAMEAGSRVWALTRGRRPLPDGVKALVADRNNMEAVQNVILGEGIRWDAVIDCICMNRTHAEWDIAVLPKVTERLIVVSTDSVYDSAHKRTPQNEDGVFISEEGPDESVSYGCNKRRMELVFQGEMNKKCPALNITIFRPGHIYGPGFLLGCFPECSRMKELADMILREEPVRLVGLGTYLIHPIFASDLARVLVECIDNEKTYGQVFCIGGPESVENREYYACIARTLGVPLHLEEVPLAGYLEKHPEYYGHLCHRIYDLSKLAATGIKMPDTPLQEGIRLQLESMGYHCYRHSYRNTVL